MNMKVKTTAIFLLTLILLIVNSLTTFASETYGTKITEDGRILTPNSITTKYVIYEDGTYEQVNVNNPVLIRKDIQPRGTVTFKYEITNWSGNTINHRFVVTATGPDLMGMNGAVYVSLSLLHNNNCIIS